MQTFVYGSPREMLTEPCGCFARSRGTSACGVPRPNEKQTATQTGHTRTQSRRPETERGENRNLNQTEGPPQARRGDHLSPDPELGNRSKRGPKPEPNVRADSSLNSEGRQNGNTGTDRMMTGGGREGTTTATTRVPRNGFANKRCRCYFSTGSSTFLRRP